MDDAKGPIETQDPKQLASAFELGPNPSANFNQLVDFVKSQSVDTQSPRFMNQLTNGVSKDCLEIEKLIAELRTTASTFEAAPAFTLAEESVFQFFAREIGWNQFEGVGTPGASLANLQAVLSAREHFASDPFLRSDARSARFHSDGKMVVLASDQAHYSVDKAVRISGLGNDALIAIESDPDGRLRADALERTLQQLASSPTPHAVLIVATAGTTVLGAFDSISEIAECVDRVQRSATRPLPIWIHVDAAWGGPVLLQPELKAQFLRQIDLADSIALDAHKLFGGALPSSIYLHRHPGLLARSQFSKKSDYLFHGDSRDQGIKAIQCGRRPDAFSFWFLIQKYGALGLGAKVSRALALSRQFQTWSVGELDHRNRRRDACGAVQLVHQPSYLNLCFNFFAEPEWTRRKQRELTARLRSELKKDRVAFINVSPVKAQGDCLRFVISHPDLSLELLKSIFTEATERAGRIKAAERNETADHWASEATTTSMVELSSGP